MRTQTFKAISGFTILFVLYHSAEYMIIFRNSAAGFLGFQALFFLLAFIIARWQGGKGLGTWGLGVNRYGGLHLVTGILFGLVLYGGSFAAGLFLHAEKLRATPPFSSVVNPFLLYVFGNFFSSFSEDILTRGYVYKHLKGKAPLPAIALLSSLVYVLNHIYRLDDGPATWLYLFALGLLLVLPLLVTGRLWFTGGLHWAGNCLFFYTHELTKTEEGPGLFSFNTLLMAGALLLAPLVYVVCRQLPGKKIIQTDAVTDAPTAQQVHL
ncbi:MAG TPA: CPBP family glutamic-type intramembrane protease [Chitinophagaceae bacterium]|jgi:membrane protease YdiL (CAAX protease family)|nr:CPBP family glutamic-type intramembrane protease [Chitinophagaceae bacterium]